jgi:hypothetical protein
MGQDHRVVLEDPFKRVGAGAFIGGKVIGVYRITTPDGTIIPVIVVHIADGGAREKRPVDMIIT